MKRFSTWLNLITGAAVLFVSACASAAPSATALPGISGNANVTATQVKPSQEPVAAIVNNQTITLAALDKQVSRGLDGIRTLGAPPPADMATYRLSVLNAMIEQMLIEQAANIQGVKVTDADVDAEFQALISSAGGKDKLLTQIAADRMTEAEYRDGLRATLITAKMRDIVTANIGSTAEQVHARHILVDAEATAKEILNKLKAGADFAQLAAQYSRDVTTKQTGGDLGWFAKGQLLQKSVEDTAFSLEKNQVGGPIKSDLGYHIIQTLERVKDRPIDPQTRSQLAQDAFEKWLQSLEKNAHIERYPNGRN